MDCFHPAVSPVANPLGKKKKKGIHTVSDSNWLYQGIRKNDFVTWAKSINWRTGKKKKKASKRAREISLAILAATCISSSQGFLRGIVIVYCFNKLPKQLYILSVSLHFSFPYFSYAWIVANDKSKNISSSLGCATGSSIQAVTITARSRAFC